MKLVYLAVAASLAAGAAHAGGYVAPIAETSPVVVEPVVTVDASDWTGFYAGLQYGKGDGELSLNGGNAKSDFDGYGVHGGYLRDFGKFVAGAELDYNKLDIDEADKGDMTRLRARAGYDMGRFLPYVTLGAAHLSADLGAVDVSETALTYGVGADFKVTERFTVGAEYTKQDFDDVDNVKGLDLDSDLVQVRGTFRF